MEDLVSENTPIHSFITLDIENTFKWSFFKLSLGNLACAKCLEGKKKMVYYINFI